MKRRRVIAIIAASLAASAPTVRAVTTPDPKFPDVRSVQVHAAGPDTFDFDVTVSSPYDSPARYADGIRARSPGGAVYGRRKLFHDHADEQPFTRDMHGVKVPAGVRSVVVEARDLKHGYGGKTVVVDLPGR